MTLTDLTAEQAVAAVATGETSSEELVHAYLERAEHDDWHSFLAIERDGALARARAMDALPTRPRLAGLPVAIKDALSTRDLTTTAGSRILEGFRPIYTATCVARLEAAGAIVFGKRHTK